MTVCIPRLMIAAPSSGAGKTTVMFGLLQALANRGLSMASFKCGPDYIDPMFHRVVTGSHAGNLDLFFTDAPTARSLMVRGAQGCDMAVLEGVMGYYDGLGATTMYASSYEVAVATETPVVLVVDARGASVSLAATICGFATFRPDAHICGVILNRCSSSLAARLAPAIEELTGIPVLGCLSSDEGVTLPSRRLGLVAADEIDNLRMVVQRVADRLEHQVDVDRLIDMASKAAPLDEGPYISPKVVKDHPHIAVARDAAFCFYYAENLTMLRDMGAELDFFSPLEDCDLPLATDAIYLGGGYPELHAHKLAENVSMRTSIRNALAGGMPCIAECGGFMYLLEGIQSAAGTTEPMVGVLPGIARDEGRLRHFGYLTLGANCDGLYGKAGTQIPAHEFHYWHADDEGSSFVAKRPTQSESWSCGYQTHNLVAGFPHVYWPARPECAASFVRAANDYARTHPKSQTHVQESKAGV